MQPLSMNNQPVVLAGMAAAAPLAGLFAVSFEGLILTNALGQCLQLNPVALEIFGLEAETLSTDLCLADFLGFKTDQAWVRWQNSQTSWTEQPQNQTLRSQAQLTTQQGQTATIPYAIIPQANDLFLWILPPPQLIQWQPSQPLTPAKLTEATYQAILETQTEMVVRFLPDSTFTYVNPAYCEMIGCKPEELLGRYFLEVIPPDAQAMMREELQAMNVLTPQHPYRIVINPSVGHDGSQVWHEWTNIALFNEAGEIIEFQATGRDITADYNFTRTLKAAKDRLQLAFDIAEMGYCEWDLRSNRLQWSDNYERLVGLEPGTFDHRIETFIDLIHPADRNRVQAVINDIIQSHQQHTIEFRIIKPSGEIAWFLARGTALYDDQGNPVRFTGVDMDITAQKLREQELQYQRDLRELLFTEATDALFLVHPDTIQIIDCNPRAVELFEAESKAELIGLVGHEDLHVNPLTPEEVADNIAQMHQKGYWSMEVEYKTRKGNYFWGNIASKPVEIAGQALTFVRITDVSQWKHTEFQLAASELRFRTIFNEAELGIAVCTAPNYRITESNPFLQQLLGYSNAELMELDFSEFTHPEDLSYEQTLLEECVAGHRDHYQLEKRCIRKDGAVIWVNLLATVVRDADGSIPFGFIMAKDITGRKQAETQLQASELRYRTIFDQASLGIAFCEAPDYRLSETNSRLQEILGYSANELQGATFSDITHPDDIPREQALIEQCLTGQQDHYQLEKRYIRKDGEICWVNLFSTVVRAADGAIPYAFAFVKDITDRKKAELQLQASEAKFRSIFTQAAMGIVYGSLSGEILSVNQAFADIVGYTAHELQGMSFADLTYPPDLARELLLVDVLMANEIPNYSIEKRYVRQDGSLVWVSLSVNKIYDETGQAVGGIGIVQDINYRKTLEQELEASHLKYQTLFEFLPIGLTLFDESGQVKESNPAAAEILGISTQAHLHLPHTAANWECYTPDGHRLTDQEFPSYRALHHWETVHGEELQVKKPDGSMAWISVTAVPLANAEVGAAIAYIDITRRKQAELELQASEAKFRGIFEQAAFGIAISPATGPVLIVNQALCKMMGYSEAELLTQDFQSVTYPPDLPGEIDLLNALQNQEIDFYQLEKRFVHKDGSLIWASVLINQLHNAQGEFIGYLGIVQDISQRKALEAELTAARQKYQTLFEVLPLGIVITDEQGHIIEVNPASEPILNLPATEQIHRSLDDYNWQCFRSDGSPMPSEEYPAVVAMRENRSVRGVEMGYQRPDGKLVWLENTVAPIPIPGLGVVLTYFDITDRKTAEQALREKDTMLQLALNAGQQGVFEIDLISGQVAVQSRYWEMLGYGKDEIQMSVRQWADWLHPDEYEAVCQIFERFVVGDSPLFWTEFRQRTKNGDWVWFSSTAISVAWDETGKPTRVMGVYQNINDRKLAAQALQEKETRLRLALDASNQGVWDVDLHTMTSTIDLNYVQMLGYESLDLHQSVADWANSLHPEDRAEVVKLFQDYISGQRDDYHVEFRIQTKAGAWKWVLSTGKIVAWDTQGQPTRIIGTHIDIDQRKQAELALAHKAEQERLFAEITNDIRRSLNLREMLASAVNNIRHILNADRVLVLRTVPNNHAETVAESVRPGLESLHNRCWLNFELSDVCMQEYLSGDFHFIDEEYRSLCNECWIPNLTDENVQSKIIAPINQTNDQGIYIWGILLIQSLQITPPWQPDDGALTAKICHQLAIAIHQAELYESLQAANSELQAANQELDHLARYDSLTQVANRRYFDEHLREEWSRMEREQHPLAIIMCDIDFFKAYNDHYGHVVGDSCLQKIAQTLQQTVNRSGDLVARYGGEEFVLILPNTPLMGAVAIAEKIQIAISQLNLPHDHSTIAQFVTLSLGITAQVPNSASSTQALIAQADQALYIAKQTGRNRYCLCDENLSLD